MKVICYNYNRKIVDWGEVMGNLIMPKQTAEPDKFYTTLSILYNAYKLGNPIVSNSDYKQKIIAAYDNYSNSSDGAMLVKQSEMVRYFAFAVGDFANRQIQISQTGIELFEAHQAGKIQREYEMIADAIINHSFGRNNTAIKSSDADIDPPKLFVKAIIELKGISNKELQTLLALTNDFGLDFDSAVNEIVNVRTDDKTIVIPKENVNKYNDTMFGAFLTEIEFCYKDADGKYQLSKSVIDKFADKFELMSIYNRAPEVTYSTIEEISPVDNEIDQDDAYKKRVTTTVGYDVESEYFQKQNRRKPKQTNTKNGKRGYATNARIAKTALEIADYKCEYEKEHLTFINKSGKPFMEMHHLIPMSAQDDFENNLDCIENIISLCPNCHSAIHYGNEEWRRTYLRSLHLKREKELKEAGIYISFEELFDKYYK